MNPGDTSSILIDRISIRRSLVASAPAWQLMKARTWYAIYDIALDWTVIFLSVFAVYKIGWTLAPIALVAIGNRQRALGNLLHEASHGNLSQNRLLNDYLAHLLLAAPLMNSLAVYRELHARHHAWLGDALRDPDLLQPLAQKGDRWLRVYTRYLAKSSLILGSISGHLITGQCRYRQLLCIAAWWIATMLPLVTANIRLGVIFLALWLSARITVFHAITTFREMTDHYGLKPGGIFSFTREIPDHGILSMLIHPHHNGYHLTHHLFPAVPYHQLPALHTQLMTLPAFNEHAIVCPSYLDGHVRTLYVRMHCDTDLRSRRNPRLDPMVSRAGDLCGIDTNAASRAHGTGASVCRRVSSLRCRLSAVPCHGANANTRSIWLSDCRRHCLGNWISSRLCRHRRRKPVAAQSLNRSSPSSSDTAYSSDRQFQPGHFTSGHMHFDNNDARFGLLHSSCYE
ncbi:fatty acid desaturase family protein [Paraburkholderia silvatlantica]|uniref:Fatty acid desaturase n=1 Tax=Paraburkholderia silvatlantica TaxID=321895 RepID=A0ABR6FY45_9BURK|nr:fatty acid desaturase [Paraburkholderia silvatlantica]MBB2931993.1 fatty acid desaturase [Paraburkholderia silvatlantica]PVY24668.1 fatty acid desaturase [Paraburkholderia silvatlantica]PXW31164.1 fatty acid desaturase [Paraburkholderia silvatlantica]